jgi:prepilin-type N-terminal cleavage/methylation domain-containing protein
MNRRNNHFTRNQPPSALTLIELLVVIAVVVILASLLLSALSSSKDNAMRTTCTGNLKQFGAACRMYGDDNRDIFTMPNWDDGTLGTLQGWLYNPSVKAQGDSTGGTNPDSAIPDPFNPPFNNESDSGAYGGGLWWQYMHSAKSYLCPKDTSTSLDYIRNKRNNMLSTYVMNGAIINYARSYDPNTPKIGSIWSPLCFLMWEPDEHLPGPGYPDGEGAYEWNDGSNIPASPPYGTEGIGRLHNKSGGEILALDGHVEFMTEAEFSQQALIPYNSGRTLLWWSTLDPNGGGSGLRP